MKAVVGLGAGRGESRRARRLREASLGYLLILPASVLFGVFVFYPFFRNFFLSLYRNPPFPGLPRSFVGLHQFGQVLGSSSFEQSLVSTLLFVLFTVPVGIAIGLLLAVAAHQRLRGVAAYRMIFSSTVATSTAVASVIFGTLMNPVVGLLPWLGINPNPSVLQNPTWALPAVSLVTVWQGVGLSFILMSAGLQSVPDDLLEAARVDGAGAWRRFWRVTVPLLSPTLFFALVVATILAFQSFGQIDILTGQQSAAVHTNVLIYYVYTALTYDHDPGKAAVLSIMLFVITMAFALVQIRVLERRVHYGR